MTAHLALTISLPTLVAVVLTAALWIWALSRDAYGSMDIGGALFIGFATAGTLAIWLARATLALWAGV